MKEIKLLNRCDTATLYDVANVTSSALEMNCLSMYIGEISAIAEDGDAQVYVTEM